MLFTSIILPDEVKFIMENLPQLITSIAALITAIAALGNSNKGK